MEFATGIMSQHVVRIAGWKFVSHRKILKSLFHPAMVQPIPAPLTLLAG